MSRKGCKSRHASYERFGLTQCPHCLGSLAAATGSAAPDWQEATDAAEAWCQITDQDGRAHAIYCYRAGYLKAKRQNDTLCRPADSEAGAQKGQPK